MTADHSLAPGHGLDSVEIALPSERVLCARGLDAGRARNARLADFPAVVSTIGSSAAVVRDVAPDVGKAGVVSRR